MICEKFHNNEKEFEFVSEGEVVSFNEVWYCPFCGERFAHVIAEEE